jgi:DNA-binding transcriptional MerR regulator
MGEVKVKASDFKRKAKPADQAAPKTVSRHVSRQKRPPRQPVAPLPDEEEDEDDVETEIVTQGGEGPDITTWPTRAEAARRIGVNKRTIMRWQKDGDLEAVVDSQGFFRFNPEDIDELAASRTGEAAQMMGQSVAMVVSNATALTGDAQKHAQAFADKHIEQSSSSFEMMREMTSLIKEENKSLREYIRELEKERREALKEVEEAKGKVHERQLKELEVSTQERRIDWAMSTLFSIAGPALMKKMGIEGPQGQAPSPPPPPAMTAGASKMAPPAGGIAPPSVNGVESEPVTGKGPIGVGDPATVQDLMRLETNTILLIANIEEPRLQLLCSMAQPHEAKALQEIWTTVDKLRKQAQENQNG